LILILYIIISQLIAEPLAEIGKTNEVEGIKEVEETPKFTPEEIAELLEAAEQHKSTGNNLFNKQKFEEAIEHYEKALNTCPVEQKKERAVYWGNIGACKIKLVYIE
jgi:valyl-tRNA synthetase